MCIVAVFVSINKPVHISISTKCNSHLYLLSFAFWVLDFNESTNIFCIFPQWIIQWTSLFFFNYSEMLKNIQALLCGLLYIQSVCMKIHATSFNITLARMTWIHSLNVYRCLCLYSNLMQWPYRNMIHVYTVREKLYTEALVHAEQIFTWELSIWSK